MRGIKSDYDLSGLTFRVRGPRSSITPNRHPEQRGWHERIERRIPKLGSGYQRTQPVERSALFPRDPSLRACLHIILALDDVFHRREGRADITTLRDA